MLFLLFLHCRFRAEKRRSGHGLALPPTPRTVSPQAKPYSRYAVAPSPQRGTPRCRLQIGEGPTLHSSQQVMLATRNSAPLRFHQTPSPKLKNFAASGGPIAAVASPCLRRSEQGLTLNPNPES